MKYIQNFPEFVSLLRQFLRKYFCIVLSIAPLYNRKGNMIDKNAKVRYKKTLRVVKKKAKVCSPLFLAATSGDGEGEIDLAWEPVKTADVYVIQKSSGALKPTKWKYEDIVTESSYTVSELKSGRKYWFRVAAVCSEKRGLWSNIVRKKTP
jgi:hypothetical protein